MESISYFRDSIIIKEIEEKKRITNFFLWKNDKLFLPFVLTRKKKSFGLNKIVVIIIIIIII